MLTDAQLRAVRGPMRRISINLCLGSSFRTYMCAVRCGPCARRCVARHTRVRRVRARGRGRAAGARRMLYNWAVFNIQSRCYYVACVCSGSAGWNVINHNHLLAALRTRTKINVLKSKISRLREARGLSVTRCTPIYAADGQWLARTSRRGCPCTCTVRSAPVPCGRDVQRLVGAQASPVLGQGHLPHPGPCTCRICLRGPPH